MRGLERKERGEWATEEVLRERGLASNPVMVNGNKDKQTQLKMSSMHRAS
jgi:hypothetical protein